MNPLTRGQWWVITFELVLDGLLTDWLDLAGQS